MLQSHWICVHPVGWAGLGFGGKCKRRSVCFRVETLGILFKWFGAMLGLFALNACCLCKLVCDKGCLPCGRLPGEKSQTRSPKHTPN